MSSAHSGPASWLHMTDAVFLFVVAVIIGILGGAAFLPLADFVSTAGWHQRAFEDGYALVIGDVTLFSLIWHPSIVTPLAQSIASSVVPPIVGLMTGWLAASAALVGCLVGRKDSRNARRTGVVLAGIAILASGSLLSALTGSLLALLYAAVLGAIGAGLVFGVAALFRMTRT